MLFPEMELITLKLCVFFTNAATIGFSFTLPCCLDLAAKEFSRWILVELLLGEAVTLLILKIYGINSRKEDTENQYHLLKHLHIHTFHSHPIVCDST